MILKALSIVVGVLRPRQVLSGNSKHGETHSIAGSFGSYPLPVRNAMRGYQKLSEAAPDKYLRYQYIDLLDKARDRISKLVNAPTDECVFVQNATAGEHIKAIPYPAS